MNKIEPIYDNENRICRSGQLSRLSRLSKFSLNITALVVVLCLYTLMIFFCKNIQSEVRAVLIIIILVVMSFYDIRENSVPLFACIGILGINIIHTVFIFFDLIIWIISFFVLTILIIIYFTNKRLIGLGDILIISFCVQALIPENVLGFLFTTFALSSIIGLVKCMNVKNIRGISIPLIPCITLAFALQFI